MVLPVIREGILPVGTVGPVACVTSDQRGDTTSRLSGQLVVLPMIREGILPVGTVRPVGCITNDQRGDTTSRYCQASWWYYQ